MVMYKLYSKMIENTSGYVISYAKVAFDNKNFNPVWIDSNIWRLYLLEKIDFNTFCLG